MIGWKVEKIVKKENYEYSTKTWDDLIANIDLLSFCYCFYVYMESTILWWVLLQTVVESQLKIAWLHKIVKYNPQNVLLN